MILTIFYVADLTKSKGFYDTAFGWPKTVDVPTYVEYQVSEGGFFGLMVRESTRQFLDSRITDLPPNPAPQAEIYLRVADVEQTITRLVTAGAVCTSPLAARNWGDEAAYFLDPDNYVIAVARPS